MLYERTSDPVHDAAVYDRQQAVSYRRWLAGCPVCDVCGEHITDKEYILVPPDGTVCQDCWAEQLGKARKHLDPVLVDALEELEFDWRHETPHEEEDIA